MLQSCLVHSPVSVKITALSRSYPRLFRVNVPFVMRFAIRQILSISTAVTNLGFTPSALSMKQIAVAWTDYLAQFAITRTNSLKYVNALGEFLYAKRLRTLNSCSMLNRMIVASRNVSVLMEVVTQTTIDTDFSCVLNATCTRFIKVAEKPRITRILSVFFA